MGDRGEWRSDRAVPAQCAGTALSSAGSVGINEAIPAEHADFKGTDPHRIHACERALTVLLSWSDSLFLTNRNVRS